MNSRQSRWAALVDDFASSGLTVHRFCERRGVAASSFYAWKRRLRGKAPVAQRGPAFVEAVVDDYPACASRGSAPVVELCCGRRIAVPQGFDEATFARLVVLLERLDVAGSREARA